MAGYRSLVAGVLLAITGATGAYCQQDSVTVGKYRIPASWDLELRRLQEAIDGNNEKGDVMIGRSDKFPFFSHNEWNFDPAKIDKKKIEAQLEAADVNPKNGVVSEKEMGEYCKKVVRKFYPD